MWGAFVKPIFTVCFDGEYLLHMQLRCCSSSHLGSIPVPSRAFMCMEGIECRLGSIGTVAVFGCVDCRVQRH